MTRIAVVNDDTDFLTLMCEVLTEKGWDAYALREGDSAFELLRQDHPDLIILDVRMDTPEMGWDILNLLTLDSETRVIPVIVCSADMVALHEKADWLEQHGIGVLPKPFDLDDLYQRVQLTLGDGQSVSLDTVAP